MSEIKLNLFIKNIKRSIILFLFKKPKPLNKIDGKYFDLSEINVCHILIIRWIYCLSENKVYFVDYI